MPDISLLVPNAARPAALRRMLRSALETAVQPRRIEVVLSFDRHDRELAQFDFPFLTLKKIPGPQWQLGRAFERCYAASSGSALILTSEDSLFQTFGWDSAFLQEMNRFDDGVALAWGTDGSEATPVSPCISRSACELLGGICPVTLHRYHAAAHLNDVFQQLADLGYNRRAYLPEIVIDQVPDQYLTFDPQAMADADFDERTYIAWDEERGLLAQDLARHIVATAARTTRSLPIRRAA